MMVSSFTSVNAAASVELIEIPHVLLLIVVCLSIFSPTPDVPSVTMQLEDALIPATARAPTDNTVLPNTRMK